MVKKNKHTDFIDRLQSKSPYIWVGCGAVIVGLGMGLFLNPIDAYATFPVTQAPDVKRAEPAPAMDSAMPMSNYNRSWVHDIKQAIVHIETGNPKKNEGGIGAGVVIDSSGWILTCNHVVRGIKEAKVVMWDGQEHKGKVTHSNDNQLDLALIKINATGLKSLSFGNSDSLYVGDRVIAAGSPLGLDHSYSFGHVSALDSNTLNKSNFMAGGGTREVYSYADVVQTDISINPGNSGGPLINERREIVGMNTIIPGATGYSVGIGFAVKSKFLKVASQILKKDGKFNRSFIGAGLENLKKYIADKHNIPGGALITQVSKNTPASKAGIKKDDIIIKIDNVVVKHQSDLRLHLLSTPPKTKVKITLIRGNDKKVIDLVTANVPKPKQTQQAPNGWNRQFGPFDEFFKRFFGPGAGPSFETPDENASEDEESTEAEEPEESDSNGEDKSSNPTQDKPKLGATVVELTKEVRSEYHIPESVKGIVIKSVNSGSIASKANLKEGDVILEFGGKKITKVDQLKEVLSKSKSGQRVPLRYGRYAKGSATEVALSIKL